MLDLAGANPIIIGIAGHAGAGKSAASDYLCRRYGFESAAFADAIKDMLALLMTERGVDYAHLHEPHLKQRPIAEFGDATAREMMQSMGDWGRALSPMFWVLQLAHRLGLQVDGTPIHDRIVIADVRYRNEAAWIAALGGVTLRLHRDDNPLTDTAAAQHDSEQHVQTLPAHVDLFNTGPTIYGLHTLLDGAMADLGIDPRAWMY